MFDVFSEIKSLPLATCWGALLTDWSYDHPIPFLPSHSRPSRLRESNPNEPWSDGIKAKKR
jgi:hypothetical protein